MGMETSEMVTDISADERLEFVRQLWESRQQESLRLGVFRLAADWPVAVDDLLVVALLTFEGRLYAARRTPTTWGDGLLVTLDRWKDVTPVEEEGEVEAGLQVDRVISTWQGWLAEAEGNLYIFDERPKLIIRPGEATLAQPTAVKLLTAPAVKVESAVMLTNLIASAPPGSPARKGSIAQLPDRRVVPVVWRSMSPQEAVKALGSSEYELVYKGPSRVKRVRRNPRKGFGSVELPGLQVEVHWHE